MYLIDQRQRRLPWEKQSIAAGAGEEALPELTGTAPDDERSTKDSVQAGLSPDEHTMHPTKADADHYAKEERGTADSRDRALQVRYSKFLCQRGVASSVIGANHNPFRQGLWGSPRIVLVARHEPTTVDGAADFATTRIVLDLSAHQTETARVHDSLDQREIDQDITVAIFQHQVVSRIDTRMNASMTVPVRHVSVDCVITLTLSAAEQSFQEAHCCHARQVACSGQVYHGRAVTVR